MNTPHVATRRRSPRPDRKSRCAVLLACVGVALGAGFAARSASSPAPSFSRSVLGTDDSVAVAIGDLDGDRRADVVTADYNPQSVSVGLNKGGGHFGHDSYPVGGLARSAAIGDLNGDRKPDLVTASQSPYTLSVLLNTGNGHFAARRDYQIGREPAAVAIAELNGDGKADLAVANDVTSTVSVLLNRGDGTFLPRIAYTSGRNPSSVALGDLNGDRKEDLATANTGSNTVSVLLNRGDGSFAARHDYGSGPSPRSIEVGDLNGDGKPDLAIANFKRRVVSDADKTVSVLLNRGDGSFRPRHGYRTGSGAFSIVVGDLNGDGTPDLATANAGPGTLSVLLNRGDGSLGTKLDYVPGLELYGWGSTAIGDLNGDRRLDLAVPMINSRNNSSFLSLLINTPGLCNVQNVVGMTFVAAGRALARINCRVGKVSRAYSNRAKRGRVIAQKPRFGAVRSGGSKVKLVVSRGRKP
jgi:FG-GAP-like repeat/PASTA domain/FG-GAP repeat